MKTKIAVISDLHGNLEATKAVLQDIQERGIDKIICLGDIVAKGVHSNECVELVRKHCFVVVRGNTDGFFSDETYLPTLEGIEKERFLWNYQLLSKENREYLLTLPLTYEFYMSGMLVRMFHASPISDYTTISHLKSPNEKFQLFQPSHLTSSQQVADIVLYGHIHYQFMEKLFCRTLINVGSVGNSLDLIREASKDGKLNEITNAHYVIIEGDYQKQRPGAIDFQFVSLAYDVQKELQELQSNIEAESYKNELEKGLYREMERLTKAKEGGF